MQHLCESQTRFAVCQSWSRDCSLAALPGLHSVVGVVDSLGSSVLSVLFSLCSFVFS